jgi:hypothetical protein
MVTEIPRPTLGARRLCGVKLETRSRAFLALGDAFDP